MRIKTYIIAEIGINHNGDLDIAKKLIDVAKHAGCDAVKFQKRTPDLCVPEHQRDILRETPWGTMRYIDYKHKIEFGEPEYDVIDAYCKKVGIDWSVSVWDAPSLEFIKKYNVPWIKVPSALATDHQLIRDCVATGKTVIVSTGMCTQEEAKDVIHTLMTPEYLYSSSSVKHCVMHTNSSYPAHVEDLNLNFIRSLAYISGGALRVGYSGHEYGIMPTIGSVYLGASIIERHITLDKSMWGTDQQSSLGPKQLIELVDAIRELEAAYGKDLDVHAGAFGPRVLTESELSVRKKLRGV